MDIEKFADILLKSMKREGMPVTEVEQRKDTLFGIAISDDSRFLVKIGKREPIRCHSAADSDWGGVTKSFL